MSPRRPPIIIDNDIEASGFGSGSDPIGVGVIMDDRLKCHSLIQLRQDWTHWRTGAEKVHGISLEILLAHSRQTFEVANRLNEMLRRRTACSDGWVVARRWLGWLYAAASMRCEFTLSWLEMLHSEQKLSAWADAKRVLLEKNRDPRHSASFYALMVKETFERTRG